MVNLTQVNGVVKPNVASAPLEGYKVVIFEETLGGTTLKTILNPGDSPIKKKSHFFSPSTTYTCYAVNSDTRLHFDFNSDMTLAAQHQHFVIQFTIYFYISEPERIAVAFKTDPIKRIQDEIEKRLQKNILEKKIQMENIQDDFFEIKGKILPDTTLNKVRHFSEEFGVIIKEIDMIHKVPEKYLAPNRKKEDYFLKKETAFIEEDEIRKKREDEKSDKIHKHDLQNLDNLQDEKNTNHQEKMEDVRGFHDFRRQLPKRLITAIDKAVESIDGAGSLERVADASIGVISRAVNQIQNPGQAQSEKYIPSSANKMKALTVESSGPFEDAKSFLFAILSKVEDSTCEPEEKKIMRSCITHLLGEVHLEEKANRGMIDKYFKELGDFAIKYRKIFNRNIMEQISEIKEDLILLITGKNK